MRRVSERAFMVGNPVEEGREFTVVGEPDLAPGIDVEVIDRVEIVAVIVVQEHTAPAGHDVEGV